MEGAEHAGGRGTARAVRKEGKGRGQVVLQSTRRGTAALFGSPSRRCLLPECLVPLLLPLLVLVPAHDDGAGEAHGSASLACSLRLSAQTVPAMHEGAPRNNPDGTYYAGDAFHYIIRYSAGPSCVSFTLHPLYNTDGLDMDRGRAPPGGTGSACGAPGGQYSGCVYGMATVTHNPDSAGCPDPDDCTDLTQEVRQTATAVKKVCYKGPGGIKCKNVHMTRTVTITPEILAPNLRPELTLETLVDSDGYDARNLDGTYYLWDPVTVRYVPVLEWKDQRENTVRFEVARDTRLETEGQIRCGRGSCSMSLENPGIMTSEWLLGNGDGLDIYNATVTGHIGLHEIGYHMTAYNLDVPLDRQTVSIDPLVVTYRPVYTQYPYPLLSDDGRTAYENRAAVAIHYFGSDGRGPDDIAGLHENRRSKINGFHYAGIGFDPWTPSLLDDRLRWSEAADVGIMEEHRDADSGHGTVISGGHDDVIPCMQGAANTTMMVRAGYCRIYFEYPILDTVTGDRGPVYENATLFNTLISDHFAGRQATYLSHYEYAFPESLFHTGLSVRSVGGGGTENPIPVRVEVSPPAGGGARDMHDYLYDKAYHDTGDAGFGRIVSGDAYPMHSQESGIGGVDLKLRRISAKFDTYRIQGGMSLDGLHITELAPAYFENSHNASLAVPLNVGLGSPSPLSVTVHANDVSRQYDYKHVDFGVPHRITVNAAQDNGLEITRQDGTVSVAPQPGFGRITSLYVDGIRAAIPCDTGCVINTPSNRAIDIDAENAWGGRAHVSVPGLAVREDPPAQGAAAGNLAVIVPFLVSLPVLYWMYRRIRRDGRP